jgi:hypothetical protein
MLPRAAGVLLHPTSLPGPYGIGDLGPAAAAFVDWAASAGFRLWQVLPLGPTGYGNSPYGSPSAFAGNPALGIPATPNGVGDTVHGVNPPRAVGVEDNGEIRASNIVARIRGEKNNTPPKNQPAQKNPQK